MSIRPPFWPSVKYLNDLMHDCKIIVRHWWSPDLSWDCYLQQIVSEHRGQSFNLFAEASQHQLHLFSVGCLPPVTSLKRWLRLCPLLHLSALQQHSPHSLHKCRFLIGLCWRWRRPHLWISAAGVAARWWRWHWQEEGRRTGAENDATGEKELSRNKEVCVWSTFVTGEAKTCSRE